MLFLIYANWNGNCHSRISAITDEKHDLAFKIARSVNMPYFLTCLVYFLCVASNAHSK